MTNEKKPLPAALESPGTGSVETRAAGALLSEINHEVRTAMNGIAGMLDLLSDSGLDDRQQQYADIAQHSVGRLLAVIERITDLALFEAGGFHLNPSSFDLLAEARNACAGLASAAERTGISLRISDPPPLSVQGDAPRFRQVIAGLAHMAINLSERGAVTIAMKAAPGQRGTIRFNAEVQASDLSESGRQLLTLLDGDAMPGDAGTHRRGGYAATLTLCRQLAHAMGGAIVADRSLLHGASVSFTADFPAAPASTGDPRLLLLAKQAQWWRDVVGAETARVDVFEQAVAGLEALSAAAGRQDPYRIVMLERTLDGMDAEVLAAAIAADPAHRDASVVLLIDEQDGNAYAGFAGVLHKTAPHRVLQDKLATFVRTARAGAQHPPSPPSPYAAASAIAGRRILVTDDNPVNQQVALHLLKKLGCVADAAADGEQALAMLQERQYDLVLMDCDMPRLDGYQTTRRLRQMEGGIGRIPVLALSACTTREERHAAISAGMNDFLPKPIRAQVLGDALNRWLVAAVTSDAPPPLPGADDGAGDELEAIRDMFGADFSELAALYLRDSPPRLEALAEACAGDDAARLAKVAHAFGGSSASIGATGMARLCKDLELCAKNGAIDDAAERLARIEAEYRRIKMKLTTMLT